MQLRYTWSTDVDPTLSDYMQVEAAIDEAARTLAEHNRPGSRLTVARIECHGPDSARWFVLWSAEGLVADAYILTFAGLYGQLDGEPLTLAALAEVLHATRQVVAEELVRGGAGGHNVMTATDVLRDRQRQGHALVGAPEFGERERVQVAQAVCITALGRIPENPLAALVRWQMGVAYDSAGELARACKSAAEGIEAVLARSQEVLKLLDDTAQLAEQPDEKR